MSRLWTVAYTFAGLVMRGAPPPGGHLPAQAAAGTVRPHGGRTDAPVAATRTTNGIMINSYDRNDAPRWPAANPALVNSRTGFALNSAVSRTGRLPWCCADAGGGRRWPRQQGDGGPEADA